MRAKALEAVPLLVVLAIGASYFMTTGVARGWVVLGGSLVIALLFVLDPSSPRRQARLVGLYAVCMGLSTGLPKVMVPTPLWGQRVADVALLVGVASMVTLAVLRRGTRRFDSV